MDLGRVRAGGGVRMDFEPGPALRGIEVERLGPRFGRPGAHQVGGVGAGVGRVAGAHQGFGVWGRRAAVERAATGDVGFAGAAGAGFEHGARLRVATSKA